MLLLNTNPRTIETKFDGQIVIFKGGERKRLQDKAQADHVYFKLQPYGVIELPDDYAHAEAKAEDPALKPFIIAGLKELRKTMNKVVQNFRTMNKEREAAKLSAEQPSETIIDCVKQIKWLDDKLAAMNADDYKMVDAYLSGSEEAAATEGIDALDRRVDADGKLTGVSTLASVAVAEPAKKPLGRPKGK